MSSHDDSFLKLEAHDVESRGTSCRKTLSANLETSKGEKRERKSVDGHFGRLPQAKQFLYDLPSRKVE